MAQRVQNLDCPQTLVFGHTRQVLKNRWIRNGHHIWLSSATENPRVGKDIAKAAGKHSFDLALRDLETPLTKGGHEEASETGRSLSSCYEFDCHLFFRVTPRHSNS